MTDGDTKEDLNKKRKRSQEPAEVESGKLNHFLSSVRIEFR